MVRVPMENEEREQLRVTFNEAAELYETARPVYPDEVLDELVELARIPAGGRLLEIGPGTGKATVALAERGFAITGVELGAHLAAVARRKLASFPAVGIVVADFEQWEPERADFDAIVAFTAFHWIARDVRYAKTARLLRPGGALAVVSVQHVLAGGADDGFWLEVQEDYDAVVPHPDNSPPPAPDEVGDWREQVEASGVYENVAIRRHLWTVEYTADEYIAVLGTYSNHLALPAAQRAELFSRIHARVAQRGTIAKTYLSILTVAHRPG
jgi:SAM-dependent methyltransferase